ncbi:hypothetical protein Q757_04205, partial [Oenococcus alcoholitolerans]
MANRAASKPANEIFGVADLVIAIGADFPFANLVYRTHPFKFVQIDADKTEFGRHHFLDLGVWSDATYFVQKAIERSQAVAPSPFFKAAVADKKNWQAYLDKLSNKNTDPLEFEPLYKSINEISNDKSVFSIDVGDNIINSFRFLNIGPKNKWVISALFASMGTGIPGAIAAKLSYPDRQVFNIAGDGAFSMVMQDLLTEKKYHLPIINIITSNKTLNFIKSEQDDLKMNHSGIDLEDQDFEMISKGMGVDAVTVSKS